MKPPIARQIIETVQKSGHLMRDEVGEVILHVLSHELDRLIKAAEAKETQRNA